MAAPKAKPGEIKLGWGREDRHDTVGLMAAWGEGTHRGDATFLFGLNYARYTPLGEPLPSFMKELEDRGYDLSTFKLSIQKKKP